MCSVFLFNHVEYMVFLGRILLFLVRLIFLVGFFEWIVYWLRGLRGSYRDRRRKTSMGVWIVFYILIYLIFVIKILTIQDLNHNIFFGAYSIAVSVYILSRFGLARIYKPDPDAAHSGYEPTVTFGVPAKDEGSNIYETLFRIMVSDYPAEKFDIIAVNDGSSDNTLEEMKEAQRVAKRMGVNMTVVDWEENRGKREGMAECVRRSKNDIIVFIDSDSFVEKDTARELVKYFSHPKIAAVAGHAYVANARKNFLTKMQDVRYFVAFKAYKSAESLFGAVTCCSGCCSAYRRSSVMEVIDAWSNQTFLGVRCTYGDDRSLTNSLLEKGYKTVFAPKAIVHTVVPDTLKKFMRQQMRWKKSWTRESFRAGLFIWKKNPIMSASFYLGLILPLLAPVVVVRALVWYPAETGLVPWFYITGLLLMAFVYGLYYYAYTRDSRWIYGVLFTLFYTFILIWQLPWAILRLRDSKWGTR